MSPPPVDPRDRVVSISIAVACLVLALPIVALVTARLSRRSLDPSGALILVPPLGLIAIAAVLIWKLKRGPGPRWLGGGFRTGLLGLLLSVLGGGLKVGANAIEDFVVARWGLSPRVADSLTGLVIVAGVVVFAVYWRRASRTLSRSAHRPPEP